MGNGLCLEKRVSGSKVGAVLQLQRFIELRDAKMDRLQQASESGLSISLYVDGRYGSYSTNRLDKKELETFIKNGIESTRYLAVDEARVLPDASRYYKGGKPDLQLFDKRFETINPDDKVAIARAAAEEVLGKDSRIISVGTSYGDGESSSYRLTSNGFEGESKSTWFSVSADVALRGEGEARPSSYWYESALFYDKLVKSGVGTKALERVLRKLGQKKVASGKYTMVVDPMNASNLLSPVLSALYGSALQQKNSFLLDKLNVKVGAGLLNLMDEPHLIGASGARYFDSEGVATERRSIFEEGVLKHTSLIPTTLKNGSGADCQLSFLIGAQTGKQRFERSGGRRAERHPGYRIQWR